MSGDLYMDPSPGGGAVKVAPLPMTGSAVFSPCGFYRYHLAREWDATKGRCLFVMLNPSRATAEILDPTVTRCLNYAKAWGYGSLEVVNIFAWRSTDPKALKQMQKRLGVSGVIGPENNAAILAAVKRADLVVCAWGNHGATFGRDAEVWALIRWRNLYCLGTAKTGRPLHPLYLSGALKPQPFEVRR